MRNPVHLLAQQLTGKPTLEECNLDEVKRIAQRYPFFAPAQFLLLQKLRQSGPAEEADAQYKKAVLFYPDPLAFELFISSDKFYDDEAAETAETAFLPTYENPVETHAFIEEERAGERTLTEESTASLPLERFETSSVPMDSSAYNSDEAGETPTESFTESDLKVAPVAPEKDKAEEFSEHESAAVLPVVQTPQSVLPVVNDERPEEEAAEATPAFEPFHTVDYFASQGIKISPDEPPKDKLGKQVKSFTEWLKTMKRLPASPTLDLTAKLAEIGVENMASRSVSDSEVLTEAMAEVWARQGATQKALDIYNKLSLHNPSKRDYFAAKIETLKHA